MKKSLQFLMIALMVSFIGVQTNAQLPSGVLTPNFTATDIDGNEHTLSDYLLEGKTVFIDVSATWCPPCWSFHQTGTLESVWEQLGPDGTDEAVVIYVEGDASTTQADLEGTGGNTQGDWLTGTNYPVIDDAAVSDVLEVTYFPTIYAICPSGLIYEIGAAEESAFLNFVNTCPTEGGIQGENNAALLSSSGSDTESLTFCGTEAPAISLNLANMGLETLTSATITLMDGSTELQSIDWTGSLEVLEQEMVNFDPVESTTGAFSLEATVSNINGSDDDDESNNMVTINSNKVFSEELTLTIDTDNWGYEIYWAFLNEDGEIVVDGGNPEVGLNGGGAQAVGAGSGYDNNIQVVEEVTLEDAGCYEFVIVDDYGDGLTAGAGYKIETASGVLFENYSFGSGNADHTFERSEGEAPAPAPNADFSYELEGNQVLVTDNSDNASSYSWDFGDGSDTVSGATPDAHEYTENGEYTITLTITNADGVEDTFEQTVTVSGVSINNIAGLTAVEVYPNPASDELNVTFQLTETTNMTIEVTNVVGQTVKAVSAQNFAAGNTNVSIDLNDISNGLYFVTFRNENGVSNQKFMVSK